MGVDYSASYGIGYRIQEPKLKKKYNCVKEYFEEILVGSKFVYFATGNELSNSNIEYYIVAQDNLNENTDLKSIKLELDSILNKNKIKSDGEFGLVGGLLIW